MSETTRESLRDLMAVFKKHPSREGYLILTVKADAALERARLALSQVDGPGQIIDELRAKLAEAEDVTQRTLKYGVILEERLSASEERSKKMQAALEKLIPFVEAFRLGPESNEREYLFQVDTRDFRMDDHLDLQRLQGYTKEFRARLTASGEKPNA